MFGELRTKSCRWHLLSPSEGNTFCWRWHSPLPALCPESRQEVRGPRTVHLWHQMRQSRAAEQLAQNQLYLHTAISQGTIWHRPSVITTDLRLQPTESRVDCQVRCCPVGACSELSLLHLPQQVNSTCLVVSGSEAANRSTELSQPSLDHISGKPQLWSETTFLIHKNHPWRLDSPPFPQSNWSKTAQLNHWLESAFTAS